MNGASIMEVTSLNIRLSYKIIIYELSHVTQFDKNHKNSSLEPNL